MSPAAAPGGFLRAAGFGAAPAAAASPGVASVVARGFRSGARSDTRLQKQAYKACQPMQACRLALQSTTSTPECVTDLFDGKRVQFRPREVALPSKQHGSACIEASSYTASVAPLSLRIGLRRRVQHA